MTMTCPVCSTPITGQPGKGRPRVYCSTTCRSVVKRREEKRRRAITAAQRDLEDAVAAHTKHDLPITAQHIQRARAHLTSLLNPTKENTMSTTTKITIPANRRLVVLFKNVEPGSTNSPGVIVDKATAYEQDGDRVYAHDEQGVFSVFEGVREALVLEAALPRIPVAQFYQLDEDIEPAN